MSANKDRLALIEHLSSIPGEYSDDLRETLDRVAFAIASGMEAEVCSLYLFDPQRERIVLRATVGLDRESVGKVSMRLSEGLVGLVLEQDEPVFVPDAIANATRSSVSRRSSEYSPGIDDRCSMRARRSLLALIVQGLG